MSDILQNLIVGMLLELPTEENYVTYLVFLLIKNWEYARVRGMVIKLWSRGCSFGVAIGLLALGFHRLLLSLRLRLSLRQVLYIIVCSSD